MLIEKLAGGVVVLDRQPGAGDAVIRGRLLDQRQRRLYAGAAEIADADFDGIGGKRAVPSALRPTTRPTNSRIMSSPGVPFHRPAMELVPV